MTIENFCYWLQGFVELNGDRPTEEQWESIKEHLGLVFKKVTSPINKSDIFFDRDRCVEGHLGSPLKSSYCESNQIAKKIKEMSPSLELSICGAPPPILDEEQIKEYQRLGFYGQNVSC